MSSGRKTAVAASLLVLSGAFILLGWWRGEIRTVFVKAVNICLECIGIG